MTRRVLLPKEARSGPRPWQGAGAGVGGSRPCPESRGASPRYRAGSSHPAQNQADLMLAPGGWGGGLRPLWLSLRKKVHTIQNKPSSRTRDAQPCQHRRGRRSVWSPLPRSGRLWGRLWGGSVWGRSHPTLTGQSSCEGPADRGRPLPRWLCLRLSPSPSGPGPAQAGAPVPGPRRVVHRCAAAPRWLWGALSQVIPSPQISLALR